MEKDNKNKNFGDNTEKIAVSDTENVLAEMEAALDDIASDNPQVEVDSPQNGKTSENLRAVLEVSLAVNSTLVTEEILKVVMAKAIELLSAERGFIMLLDDRGELQFKSAHNIARETMTEEDFKISTSISREVAETGKAVYTSDALSDSRFSNQQSVVELHLRSIMCVPLKIQNSVIGLIYLDNSSEAKLFLKSDLYLFELFAAQAAQAIHNASLYDSMLDLKRFNEKVVNNSPVGVVVIDANRRLVSINDAALSVLDKNRDDIRLLTDDDKPSEYLELIPASEKSKWQHMIDSTLKSGKALEDPRYFHNTGYAEKVLSVKISPISKIPTGGDGLILIMEDITEIIIMEKYVILSEKLVARGEMAASIAHELNNYLAIIANNAELLAYNIDSEKYDKLKNNSRQIIDTITRMKRFTDGLMDFSKLETETIKYEARHLIEELMFTVRSQARFKDVELSLDIEKGLPDFEIDVGQIQQVILNLLINAADALEERRKKEAADGHEDFIKKIKIKAHYDKEESRLKIMVIDNGPGIPVEHQSKIFQLHFTTKDSGHGIGLANCKKIIANHNGDIIFESTPGRGTTFTIALPERQPTAVR
jgi:signal transduction histidine kinase